MPPQDAGSGADALVRRGIAGGELRVDARLERELETLGLTDLERWRRGDVGGEPVHARARGGPVRWVRRIVGASGTYYAKYQRGARASEWWNEWLHLRAPRSAAGREERASRTLRDLEVACARVVLSGEVRGSWGALGPERESFLVTAAVDGAPLTAQSLDADRRADLATLVARLSRAGVHVPDLYAKHVLCAAAPRSPLVLIDLPRVEPRSWHRPAVLAMRHAAGLAATLPELDARALLAEALERPSPRLERRVLERVALLRARKKLPDRGAHPGQPAPGDYGARHRYDTRTEVAGYRARNRSRHARELELVGALLPPRLAGAVLDAPCGAGRFSVELARRGARVLALDFSPAMAAATREAGVSSAVAELERLPLADGSLAGALCFRFLHHAPPEVRRRVLAELARTCREFFVASFFHPVSAHNATRALRSALTGLPPSRHAVTVSELERDLAALGWRVDDVRAESAWRRDLWALRAVPQREPARS